MACKKLEYNVLTERNVNVEEEVAGNSHPSTASTGKEDVNIFHQNLSSFKSKENCQIDRKLLSYIMEIFPDASPRFLEIICDGQKNDALTVNFLVSQILSTNYPKRKNRDPSPEKELDPDQQYEMLKEILPDADPSYLRHNIDHHINNKDAYKQFLTDCIELKMYPTMKDYLRKQQLSAQARQYTTDFDLENFLKVIPDPTTYFGGKKKTAKPINIYTNSYILGVLKNKYPQVQVKVITTIFNTCKSLEKAFEKLDSYVAKGEIMKTKRKPCPLDHTAQTIPLLQKLAYLIHREEIEEYLTSKKKEEQKLRAKAKKEGTFLQCGCCFDHELIATDTVTCEKHCIFCKSCLANSVKISFGEGKLDFPCLADCDSSFSLKTLQYVLDPKLFSKIALKKQVEEVKAAGIEDLDVCPFCDFATIVPKEDKIFKCLSPDCMIESCRMCKEPSHIPLKCDEVEKDEDVKKRTYVENKMTEALLRNCVKCNRKFIKEGGCNKMTCSCGACMCYVCGKPVENYKHFNGQGGDQYHLCPLFSDTIELHKTAVLKGAMEAKKEINAEKLVIDPTADIEQHFKELRKIQKPMPNRELIPNDGGVIVMPQLPAQPRVLPANIIIQ